MELGFEPQTVRLQSHPFSPSTKLSHKVSTLSQVIILSIQLKLRE